MSAPKYASVEHYLAALEPAKAATLRAIDWEIDKDLVRDLVRARLAEL